MLSHLRAPGDSFFGILSSHPFALLAALRAFSTGIENVDLTNAKNEAKRVMERSPVPYVRDARLRGRLFGGDAGALTGGEGLEAGSVEERGDASAGDRREQKGDEGSVCCADTGFWVDHAEPRAALEIVKNRGVEWPYGDLPEGCEFLVLVKGVKE